LAPPNQGACGVLLGGQVEVGTIENMKPTHTLSRTARILAALVSTMAGVGAAGVWVVWQRTTPAAIVAVAIAGVGAVYAASTRQRKAGAVIRALMATWILATVGAALTDGWWALLVAGIGALAWFVARTMRGYLRPAEQIPADVASLIAKHITLSEESISGVSIGIRPSDAAVFGVIYAGEVVGRPEEARCVRKAIDSVAAARSIMQRNNGVEANMIVVAGGTFGRVEIEGTWVSDPSSFAKTVAATKGPEAAQIAEIAKANGIELNRQQTRRIGKKPGKTGGHGGKKIVHRGRVTRVEP